MGPTESLFITDQDWIAAHPGAKAGILVIKNISNVSEGDTLKDAAVAIENNLRKDLQGFSRDDINGLPVIKAYNNYYKNFGKTYHVRSQVESILNGKALSSGSPIITAMFMAEVKNMLLTAGHDLNTLTLPVHIKVASGGETFIDIRGSEKNMIAGDMIMEDGKGIISSVILGPDRRTKLTPNVKDVLYTVYAPSDIGKEEVFSHLRDIESYVKIFSPDSTTHALEVFEA
jgi:DNA/RNA-binding domain of Phe-tRNA-synthetase-like protein